MNGCKIKRDLIKALLLMMSQYLTDGKGDDVFDNRHMTAGETAFDILYELDLLNGNDRCATLKVENLHKYGITKDLDNID